MTGTNIQALRDALVIIDAVRNGDPLTPEDACAVSVALRRGAAEVEHLTAELAAARVDAERYRWLRSQHWDSSRIVCVVDPKSAVKLGHNCPSEARLDAAIDAARTA